MKKIQAILGVLIVLLSVSLNTQAQSFTRKGNTFEQVSSKKTSSSKQTQFTWTDSKGKTYPIFITKNGRCFVNKISSKTGKEYKYYLPKEIALEVCKELGITYLEKTK